MRTQICTQMVTRTLPLLILPMVVLLAKVRLHETRPLHFLCEDLFRGNCGCQTSMRPPQTSKLAPSPHSHWYSTHTRCPTSSNGACWSSWRVELQHFLVYQGAWSMLGDIEPALSHRLVLRITGEDFGCQPPALHRYRQLFFAAPALAGHGRGDGAGTTRPSAGTSWPFEAGFAAPGSPWPALAAAMSPSPPCAFFLDG